MGLFEALLAVGLLTTAYLLLFTADRSSGCGRAAGLWPPRTLTKEERRT
jgi:hypothetical protein